MRRANKDRAAADERNKWLDGGLNLVGVPPPPHFIECYQVEGQHASVEIGELLLLPVGRLPGPDRPKNDRVG